jgi:hypothetical protein
MSILLRNCVSICPRRFLLGGGLFFIRDCLAIRVGEAVLQMPASGMSISEWPAVLACEGSGQL